MRRLNRTFRHILYLWLLLSSNALALLADSKAPIEVQAETVIIDEHKGLSVYTGDAKVTQGTLILSAEKIELLSVDNKVTQITAIGTPQKNAHYRQNQRNQPRFIEARAQHITYFLQKGVIHLQGHAHLARGFDSFSGHTLDYDVKNDAIIANKLKNSSEPVRFKIRL